jgi:hypothetical protein
MTKSDIAWLPKPEEHNYPAAESYLALIYAPQKAAALVKDLKSAGMTNFKAKDIFRASQLALLGSSNSHVAKDLEKMHGKEKISPLLLVRDMATSKVVIADGYHRLCAVYTLDEDAIIPCKIV